MNYKKGDILKYNGSSDHLNKNKIKKGKRAMVMEDFNSKDQKYINIEWLDPNCSMLPGLYNPESFDLFITREEIMYKIQKNREEVPTVGKIMSKYKN